MKELLEAGVHFGHQVRRWNPKMKDYIFGERNGIYIIDLQKTQKLFRDALGFVQDFIAEKPNAKILFVGTKRQAQDAIVEEAQRCNQYFVSNRWLGGLMTNYKTVQKSIKRLKEIEAMKEDGRAEMLTKKERLQLGRELDKLMKNLSGIKDMGGLPDILFVIDVRKEDIAIKEANRLNIPVVAVVDTNCSPEGIDYVIPGNDDALRAIRLFTSRIADAILEGQNLASEGMDQISDEQLEGQDGEEQAGAPEADAEPEQVEAIDKEIPAETEKPKGESAAKPEAEPKAVAEKKTEAKPDKVVEKKTEAKPDKVVEKKAEAPAGDPKSAAEDKSDTETKVPAAKTKKADTATEGDAVKEEKTEASAS